MGHLQRRRSTMERRTGRKPLTPTLPASATLVPTHLPVANASQLLDRAICSATLASPIGGATARPAEPGSSRDCHRADSMELP